MFKGNQLIGFGGHVQAGCSGQTEITYNVAIGDATNNGGLAAAFNGNLDLGAASCAAVAAAVSEAFVGDDAGVGNSHSINGVKIWGSNNAGYATGTPNVDFQLYGSNSAPANATDGTKIVDLELGVTDGAVANPRDYTSSPT